MRPNTLIKALDEANAWPSQETLESAANWANSAWDLNLGAFTSPPVEEIIHLWDTKVFDKTSIEFRKLHRKIGYAQYEGSFDSPKIAITEYALPDNLYVDVLLHETAHLLDMCLRASVDVKWNDNNVPPHIWRLIKPHNLIWKGIAKALGCTAEHKLKLTFKTEADKEAYFKWQRGTFKVVSECPDCGAQWKRRRFNPKYWNTRMCRDCNTKLIAYEGGPTTNAACRN